jgi:hypothetical protein
VKLIVTEDENISLEGSIENSGFINCRRLLD